MLKFVAMCACSAALFGAVVGTSSSPHYVIHSHSMKPVLYEGVTVSCDMAAGALEAGDIIVYRTARQPQTAWVKTVVAFGGDTVQVHDQTLFINGKKLGRTAVSGSSGKDQNVGRAHVTEQLPNGRTINVIYSDAGAYSNFGPAVRVPEGHVFVLGNNRDHSVDSRDVRRHGTVPMDQIICTAKSGNETLASTAQPASGN